MLRREPQVEANALPDDDSNLAAPMIDPDPDAAQAAAALESALRSKGSPDRAIQEKRYLKSELEHFGASVPAIRAVVQGFSRDHPDLGRSELLRLVDVLWARPIHECRMGTVELLGRYRALLEPSDLALLERLIRESRTWALVDGLAASLVGPLVEHRPDTGPVLDRWAADPDFWLRRAALLALLLPLRRGEGSFDRFARYADSMLEEREFFIRKAIGWVLRETGKKRPELVHAWLLPRVRKASGVTVREAVKHLPEPMRQELLERRRSG